MTSPARSETPDVSILMLAYNHEPYIVQALESILEQPLGVSIELIVGEDNSTDRTLEILRSTLDRYQVSIRILTSEVNVGMGENFRRLVRASRGRYIAFLEGDDYWLRPRLLHKQMKLLDEDPRLAFVYADFDRASCIDGAWRILPQSIQRSAPLRRGDLFEELLDRIDIHLSTVLCRAMLARAYVDSDLFDPSLKLADVPLFLYLAAHGGVEALSESVSVYRHNPSSITQVSGMSRLAVIRDHLVAVERFEDAFGSPPERRVPRQSRMRTVLTDAAYFAGDRSTFRKLQDRFSFKSLCRDLLMRFPLLHNAWLNRSQAEQRRLFLQASVPPILTART